MTDQVVEVALEDVSRLYGVRFRNHHASEVTIFCEGIVCGPRGVRTSLSKDQDDQDLSIRQQTVILTDTPHFQDRAQDWFQIMLKEELITFARALAQAQIADNESDDQQVLKEAGEASLHKLRLRLHPVQSSPVWAHKTLYLQHIEPLFSTEDSCESKEGLVDQSQHRSLQPRCTSEPPPLQVACQQLDVHLATLEGLLMRKQLRNA